MQLTRTHRILIGVVVTGAVVIAAIGFAGSYSAVRDLAHDKGFGAFANVLPIGIDAGIVVLLALDLLLTWLRIPFPLLRQTAWLLTAATIAFNGAAAWPDPLGVGMHAVIPVLFVVSVEAARHAIGRIADITADRHMESVRVARWLLAPVPTFRLWRRMKLWELRSYDQVIRLEQDRLVYRARLRARYGRAWRRKAPVESLMPLRLARYGVPLAETAPAGLAAAGLDPAELTPAALPALPYGGGNAGVPGAAGAVGIPGAGGIPGAAGAQGAVGAAGADRAGAQERELPLSFPLPVYQQQGYQQPATPEHDGRAATGFEQAAGHPAAGQPQAQAQDEGQQPQTQQPRPEAQAAQQPQTQQFPPQTDEAQAAGAQLTVPVGPGRVRALGGQGTSSQVPYVPAQRGLEPFGEPELSEGAIPPANLPDDMPRDEAYYGAFRQHVTNNGKFPSPYQFGRLLRERYGITDLNDGDVRRHLEDCKERYKLEMGTESIP
ncbi:DUF2637 domain-containing protein [Streptomyces sp. ME19-01-6]|uniref:DUF2637 domain-containing protein n=1 Tax=Streptomyces sp. ME19-01-6 TaxID=3028686 RepID=UPI0029B3D7D2|nr:DUF2637 domain-containing protein [Streptomyces sp. ME19-01-6]MDX3226648.1 DUF2637 domain-containing protein [Streptomyces sp. ME19-01-6]